MLAFELPSAWSQGMMRKALPTHGFNHNEPFQQYNGFHDVADGVEGRDFGTCL